MSPGDELPDYPPFKIHSNEPYMSPRKEAKIAWTRAAMNAAHEAEKMAALGVHKSICNRIIEPFVHVNCLVTGTEPGWMNFFGLRLDGAADPTLRALAEASWRSWNESEPRKLEHGQWHLPYADDPQSSDEVEAWRCEVHADPSLGSDDVLQTLLRVSVARCAHLSHESFETGERMGVERCLAVVDKLFPGPGKPIHASPFEHQAYVDEEVTVLGAVRDAVDCPWLDSLLSADGKMWKNGHLSGNLGPGWIQNRKLLPGEAVAPLPEVYR
jgi:hypothetical protein